MKQPRVEPTPEQWRQAFQRLQRRGGWPATLEAAKDDQRFAPRLRGMAVALAREALARSLNTPAHAAPPAPRTPQVPALLRPPSFDARRAAANDLPDED